MRFHAGIGKLEDKIGMIHPLNVFIEITSRTDRPYPFGVISVKDGDEARQPAFDVIFINIVCQRQPGLRPVITRIVRHFDGQRPPVHQGRVGGRQASQGIQVLRQGKGGKAHSRGHELRQDHTLCGRGRQRGERGQIQRRGRRACIGRAGDIFGAWLKRSRGGNPTEGDVGGLDVTRGNKSNQ